MMGHQRGTKKVFLPAGSQHFCLCKLPIGQRHRDGPAVPSAISLGSVLSPAMHTSVVAQWFHFSFAFPASLLGTLPFPQTAHCCQEGPISQEPNSWTTWKKSGKGGGLGLSLCSTLHPPFHLCPLATGELGTAREAAPLLPSAHCSQTSRRALWYLPRSGGQRSCSRPQWPDPGESYSIMDLL